MAHSGEVNSLANPDEQTMVSTSQDKTIGIWRSLIEQKVMEANASCSTAIA
jgi:hypothetical protein